MSGRGARVRSRLAALALALSAAAAGCGGDSGSVVGRWQRVDQPREWLRFDEDRTFTGRGFTRDTATIRGRYEQRGDTVTGTSVHGHTRTLTLRGGVLEMEDGTRYRRAEGAP